MSSPGFEPSPYGTASSIANPYTASLHLTCLREKRHDRWSSHRWSVRVQNNQPCGCFKDQCVKGLTVYTNLDKVSFEKHNSGRKSKLKGRDRRVLKRIVTRKHKTTVPQITYEINIHFQNPVSMQTIQRELYAANIHDRVAIPKPLGLGPECYVETTGC
ncbi:transposable element Tc1 transposase [Trichonephila clavipes]|nr:transposable element Tc1 transposase [Trichonephila clavipes]